MISLRSLAPTALPVYASNHETRSSPLKFEYLYHSQLYIYWMYSSLRTQTNPSNNKILLDRKFMRWTGVPHRWTDLRFERESFRSTWRRLATKFDDSHQRIQATRYCITNFKQTLRVFHHAGYAKLLLTVGHENRSAPMIKSTTADHAT